MPAGLEPKSGSVRPKQPIASPAASRGSHWLLLFLQIRTVQIANIDSEPCTDTRTAEPAVAGFQLHTRQAVAHSVGARTPITLQMHAQHPERAELLGQLFGQRGLFEPLADVGPQPGIDELPHRRGDVTLVVIEQPIGVEQLQRPVSWTSWQPVRRWRS